jgi:RNA polymerase sigma factor (sigma-70 family)
LTPLLQVQADYRLPGSLRHLYDPQDLVDDVWLAVLPRLGELGERDGRWTPVLLRYLGTSLLRRVNELRRKHLMGKPSQETISRGASIQNATHPLAVTVTGAVTRASRSESTCMLREAIASLESRDREVVILRGIEQLSNQATAELMGDTPAAVAMRFHRALKRLRVRLPGSVFDEIDPG